MGVLSGGEQARVRLATLILQQPELLILDEPTNHLDIPSREVLEEALQEFSGTIIVVSHDRYFLDQVVDRLLVMRPEGCALYAGNYSYYIDQVEQKRSSATAAAGENPTPRRARGGEPRRRKAVAAGEDAARAPRRTARYDRLSIEELEAMVVEREVKLAALQERFGDPEVYKDLDALEELQEEVDALTAELADVDAAWQERADAQ
ncbi:MAG: ATP-binding cassette domain-containing protein [Planctomycetes bacterium]|nr:ATP-binding cassette domain-containing protein [Planctomycetota bacterium]